ncbi:MAG TPA: hypothetical protein VGW14_05740 [Thermoleophilaceae bacterium]|nr:hypothetical protein [Thermoleophilaceae bacterium]
MQLRRLIVAVAVIACVALGGAAPSFAEPAWAPVGSAAIQPGNQTFTDGAQCTSNFVFYDTANNVYIGQAAHCSGTGGATETNGCDSGTLPNGTAVEIEDATQPGTMVYNSWTAMQQAGESNRDACDFNDFALVAIHPADAASVNPTIPFWGGPTGTAGSVRDTEKVLSYGNSSLRLGIEQLKPKEGVKVATEGSGWSHQVYTVTPGIPGDSGSAFIDDAGRAFGVLSTLQIAPTAGSNGVSDVTRAIAYMESHGGPDVTLASGTEAFTGPLLPVP